VPLIMMAADVISTVAENDDLIITSLGGDHLIYAYIDLFHWIQNEQRHTAEFLVHPSLRGLFESIHALFMKSDRSNLDPFILSQYGASRGAWGESCWLFWLGRERPRHHHSNAIGSFPSVA
jgi:hypothetical protein